MWKDEGTANVGGFMTTFRREHYYRYVRELGTGALWILAIEPQQSFTDAIANAQFVDRRGDWTTEPIED
jgi:hypothetical protein